jgi:hypothetical protein
MADDPQEPKSGCCLSRLLSLFVFVMISGLAVAIYFAAKPQDMSSVGGYDPAAARDGSRDLTAVLRASLRHGHPLTLTEAEINRWLHRTLKARQGGPLAAYVTLDGVWVRLQDERAEIIIERRVLGRPLTVSMFVKVEQLQTPTGVQTMIHRHGGPYHASLPKPMQGGRFGCLVVPQGFLNLVIGSYNKLASAYREEIGLAFEEMARIRIEPGRLMLESREPTSDASTLPGVF